MCTVSYIPYARDKKFILTSNRDEKVLRPTIAPVVYKHGDVHICYPKDKKAGGSWIAFNNRGRLSCLLNGAYVAHQKQDYYKQSRGKVLIELVSTELNAHDFFSAKNLSDVEPFTIISIDRKNEEINDFIEFIWDGEKKHFRTMDKTHPHIWSSVTLYDKETRTLREQWFKQFMSENSHNISPGKVFEFHSGHHTSDNAINLVMDRKDGLKTVSITQVMQNGNDPLMKYFNLVRNANYETKL